MVPWIGRGLICEINRTPKVSRAFLQNRLERSSQTAAVLVVMISPVEMPRDDK